MRRYALGINILLIFVRSDSYKNQSFISKFEFIKKEKNLYYKLDELIYILFISNLESFIILIYN